MIKCYETGMIIPTSEKLFGISCPATNAVFPICGSCLGSIPETAKRKGPGSTCEKDEDGIDVYEATAAENSEGGFDDNTFTSGKYVFSLSKTNARKYLPASHKKLPRPATKTQVQVA